jgi:predicted Zn-dependent protease
LALTLNKPIKPLLIKRISFITLIIILFLASVFYAEAETDPCSQALTYRIASIDPRYDINQEQLIEIMKEVGALWSTVAGESLIKYSDNGDLAIHLIYSDSQHKSRQEQKLSGKIDVRRQQVSMLKQQYERLSKRYEKKLNTLKRQVEKVNRFIENEKYNIAENKREINNLKYRIDQQHAEVESLRQRLNQKSERINELTGQTNELISIYNKEFARTRKFHQGRYVQKGDIRMVKIFQFNNQQELRLVLAHEIGHAMGLDHVENAESVMYYLLDKQNVYDLTLTKQDIKALSNLCGA